MDRTFTQMFAKILIQDGQCQTSSHASDGSSQLRAEARADQPFSSCAVKEDAIASAEPEPPLRCRLVALALFFSCVLVFAIVEYTNSFAMVDSHTKIEPPVYLSPYVSTEIGRWIHSPPPPQHARARNKKSSFGVIGLYFNGNKYAQIFKNRSCLSAKEDFANVTVRTVSDVSKRGLRRNS